MGRKSGFDALSATRSTVVAMADGSTRRIRFERHLHIRQPSVRRPRKPHLCLREPNSALSNTIRTYGAPLRQRGRLCAVTTITATADAPHPTLDASNTAVASCTPSGSSTRTIISGATAARKFHSHNGQDLQSE
jgi:hypothetical protein